MISKCSSSILILVNQSTLGLAVNHRNQATDRNLRKPLKKLFKIHKNLPSFSVKLKMRINQCNEVFNSPIKL